MSSLAYVDQPCDRCGSKRRVLRTWKETVPMLQRTTVVEYSQIICTNDICQHELDVSLEKEAKKRAEMRKKKEENDKIRKENSLRQARMSHRIRSKRKSLLS